MLSNTTFCILIVGAGGTGGNVITNLCRLIEPVKHKKISIVVADGDLIEKKNRSRQPYSFNEEGKNKAEVLVKKCSYAFDVNITAYPYYIEDMQSISQLFEDYEGTQIIVGAVDNNRTRKLLHKYFISTDDLFYIDSGNLEWDGQVVCGIRANNHTMSEPIGSIYPDILEDTKSIFKSQESCGAVRYDKPQQFVTNLQAAVIVLSYLSDIIITQDINTYHTTFNIKKKNIRTEKVAWCDLYNN